MQNISFLGTCNTACRCNRRQNTPRNTHNGLAQAEHRHTLHAGAYCTDGALLAPTSRSDTAPRRTSSVGAYCVLQRLRRHTSQAGGYCVDAYCAFHRLRRLMWALALISRRPLLCASADVPGPTVCRQILHTGRFCSSGHTLDPIASWRIPRHCIHRRIIYCISQPASALNISHIARTTPILLIVCMLYAL